MQSSMPVLDRCSTGSCRPALRSLELRQNDGRARAHLGGPMSFEIVPTGAALGAEIRGANLAGPLNDATFTAIERAYNQYGVIFFRDQHITPPQQVAFTRRFREIEFNIFGERWSVPGSPEIVVVSNATEDRPSDRRALRRRDFLPGSQELKWRDGNPA